MHAAIPIFVAALAIAEPATGAAIAEEHAARASSLWAEGDLDAALRELEAAYALDPIPKYLYGLGQIAMADGDCPRALGYFRRFRDALPDTPLADEAKREEIEAEVERAIEECGGEEEDAAPVEVVAPPAKVVAPRPSPMPPTDPDRDPVSATKWSRDPTGGVLLGVGSAATLAGIALITAGAITDRRLDDADSARDFLDARQRARNLGIAGATVLSIGTALLVGAVVRYVVVARREARSGSRSAAVVTGGRRHR